MDSIQPCLENRLSTATLKYVFGKAGMKEALAIDLLCALLGGEQEVRHYYGTAQSQHFIQVDCESEEYVMEFGLDKRSSFDSIHQAIFASIITGKKPKIIIIDTDLQESKEEYQIRVAAKELNIEYLSVYLNEIVMLLEIPAVRQQFDLKWQFNIGQ
ncbi:MAG: hypothetical protein ACU0DI_04405 [Paracoccaceae bacterium]